MNMKNALLAPVALCLLVLATSLLLMSGTAFAQFGSGDDSIGMDTTYFEFGNNFGLVRRENFFSGGVLVDQLDNLSWFGFDDDEDPIDEVVVVARRTQLGNYFDLSTQLRFGNMFTEVCTNYTDGGHCNVHDTVVDTANWPIEGGCQTVSAATPPLTGAQDISSRQPKKSRWICELIPLSPENIVSGH